MFSLFSCLTLAAQVDQDGRDQEEDAVVEDGDGERDGESGSARRRVQGGHQPCREDRGVGGCKADCSGSCNSTIIYESVASCFYYCKSGWQNFHFLQTSTFCQVRDLQKKMQHVENELDITLEKLTQTATKLDEKLKAYALAEGEIQALKRKISLLEDELERFCLLQQVWLKIIPTFAGPSRRVLSRQKNFLKHLL